MDCLPIMSEEDVRDLTFGNKFCSNLFSLIYLCVDVFQLKHARSYAEEVFYHGSNWHSKVHRTTMSKYVKFKTCPHSICT